MTIRNKPVGSINSDGRTPTIHLGRPDAEFYDQVRPKVPLEILRTNEGIQTGIPRMKHLSEKDEAINRIPLKPSSAEVLLYVATDDSQAYQTRLTAAIRLTEMNNSMQAKYMRDHGIMGMAMGGLTIGVGVWISVQNTYLLATAIANNPSGSHKGSIAVDIGSSLVALKFFKDGTKQLGEGLGAIMGSRMSKRVFRAAKETGRMKLEIEQPEARGSAEGSA